MKVMGMQPRSGASPHLFVRLHPMLQAHACMRASAGHVPAHGIHASAAAHAHCHGHGVSARPLVPACLPACLRLLAQGLGPDLVAGYREAVQLREQDWGNFQDPGTQVGGGGGGGAGSRGWGVGAGGFFSSADRPHYYCTRHDVVAVCTALRHFEGRRRVEGLGRARGYQTALALLACT